MPAKDYITGKSLPRDYKGFSTERLTELLKMRLSHQSLEGVPVEEISAMNHLDREFKLSPIYNVPKSPLQNRPRSHDLPAGRYIARPDGF